MTEVLARINGERKSLSLKQAAHLIETLHPALRSIHEAIAKHVHPEPTMTKDEFIDAVLAAADNWHVVKAVRETSGGNSAMVVKALEREDG